MRGFGVHVSVIEPGLIRTSFGETAVGSVPEHDGPYSEFNTAVARATASAYDARPAAGHGAPARPGQGAGALRRADPRRDRRLGRRDRLTPRDPGRRQNQVLHHGVTGERNIASAFATQGFVFISLTTRLPDFSDRWHLSDLELSGLLLMMVLLAGVGSVLAEHLAEQWALESRRLVELARLHRHGALLERD